MRTSFILHTDSLCVLEELTQSQMGDLFYAIYCYQINKEFELDGIVKIAFSQFKNQFIRDDEKYKKTVEARKIAGSMGGKQRQVNQANATKCKQNVANQADSDSNSKKDSDKDSENNNIISNHFTKQQIQDILKYRKSIKKPIKTQQGFNGLQKKILEVIEYYSVTLEDVLTLMAEREWQSINKDWKEVSERFTQPTQQIYFLG